jgi:hypothetical protein
MKEENRYHRIIEEIFFKSYRKGLTEVPFEREDILLAAEKLRIKLPKNIGDLIYSFRYRVALPKSVVKEAPRSQAWIIRPRGRAKIRLCRRLFHDNRSIAVACRDKSSRCNTGDDR